MSRGLSYSTSGKGIYFKTQCLIFIQLFIFGATNKSLMIGDSLQTHQETACENYSISLRCPGDDLIQVKIARYGRNDDRTCISHSTSNSNIHCGLYLQTSAVSKRCNGKNDCSFLVGPETLTDPCPGTAKYLQVLWDCLPFVASCPSSLKNVSKESSSLTERDENGAWAQDPFQQTQKIFYLGWTKYDGGELLYEYASTAALTSGNPITFHRIPDRVDGTGFAVYDSSFYYNAERSRKVARYDLSAGKKVAEKEIPKANYHGTSPYAVLMDTDIDLAVDENGLWVIYATEANNGNIVLSRLDSKSLDIISTWETTYPKRSALNAFVICGVLYVVNYDSLTIDYMFNSSSGVGKKISKVIPELSPRTSSMDYNPKDQMLYVWDSHSAIKYKLTFETPAAATSTTKPSPSTTTVLPSSRPSAKPSVTASTAVSAKPNPTSSPSNKPAHRLSCKGTEASGLMWKDTEYSEMAFLPCPGIGAGHAIWLCGGSAAKPTWTTKQPDLSQCASGWIKDLIEEIDVARLSVGDLSIKLLANLVKSKDELTSWDISMIIRALKRLLKSAESEPRNAATLTTTAIKTGSILLSPNVSKVWEALMDSLQTRLASDLMDVVEDAGFFLAKDIASDSINSNKSTPGRSGDFAVDWNEPHTALAIAIVDPEPQKTGKNSVLHWKSRHGDLVTVDGKAISEAVDDRQKKALVFLSFQNLGNYINEPKGWGSRAYPINSNVVLVSAASASPDTFERLNHPIQLKRPIVLKLRHRDRGFPFSYCAFRDDKSDNADWSQTGCRRLNGNQSHSVCQCDHLTRFGVVSTMVAPDPSSTVDPILNDLPLNYLNVARSGVVISFVILVAVLLTLLCYRKSVDVKTLHKNIVFSLCFTELVFLIGVHQTSAQGVCLATGVLLHFGVLSVFTWHALEAAHIFMVLGDPLERNDRWRWYYVTGYSCPLLVVAISCAVNYKAYGGFLVCWLRNENGFVWSLIGPCCVALSLCVIFLALSFRRLKETQLRMTEESRSARSHAARTGLLLFLIVAMWSCGLLWLGNFEPQYTSALFCIFSSGHGVVTFIFYCLIPTEIRGMYSKILSRKKRSLGGHPSGLDRSIDYSDSVTLRSNLRCDGTTRTVYHYQTGALVQPGGQQHFQSMRLAKAAAAMDPETSPPNLNMAVDNSFQQFPDCECLMRVDDTDPKLPSASGNQIRSATTMNQYHCTMHSHASQHVSCRGERLPSPVANQYEQPSRHHYCQCTQNSSASGCYDHLREEPYNRAQRSVVERQRTAPFCHRCSSNARQLQHRAPHHYETLTSFAAEDHQLLEQRHEPVNMERRHCYEDVSLQRVQLSPRVRPLSNHSFNELRLHHSVPHPYKQASSSTDNLCYSAATCGNHLNPRYRVHPFEKPESSPENHSRSGRHSDPLSTDQGYDTDSQLPAHPITHHRNSNDLVKPHFTSLVVKTSRPDQEILGQQTSTRLRSNSSSGKSDCPSENDREVELIIGSTSQSPNSPENAPVPVPGSQPACELDASYTEGIDTEVGGCVSACGTVASWSALPASDLCLPNANLQNLKNAIVSRSAENGLATGNAPSRRGATSASEICRNGNCSTYTLPGTAQTGTKARIDLKSGGISMITNL